MLVHEKELGFLAQDPSVLMQLGVKNGFAGAQDRLSPASFLDLQTSQRLRNGKQKLHDHA